MRTWTTARPARTLLSLAAFALVVTACGGNEPDDTGETDTEDASTPSEAEDPADQDAPDEDSAGDTEDPAGADDGGEGTGGAASLEEVLELLQRAERQPQQVTYDVQGLEELGTATMTLAHDPPRSAMLMETADSSFHVISDDQSSVTCFTEGDAWQCFSGPAGDDLTEGFSVPDADDLDLEDGEEPDRIESATILGRDAICLYFDEQDEATDIEACFDTESGAFLRMRGTEAGATFSMEATAVSAVDARLFDPPAEPMDMQF